MLLTSVHRVRIQRLLFGFPVTGDVKAVVARATSRCHLHRPRVMHLVDVNPSCILFTAGPVDKKPVDK